MTGIINGRRGLKRGIVGALVVVVALDAALGIYVWRATASHAPTERTSLESLRERHRRVGDDVLHAEQIQAHLPAAERECNAFYDARFLSTSRGYSVVVDDLGSIAKTAGLPPSTINFKQRELEKRNVIEVEVTASVEGDYPALVRFVNGLERSEHMYLLDSLSLTTGQDKRVKLGLLMKTYFRAAK
jgi:Tfp pilus assembly protein PilO